jgi:hypothetical protein
LDCNLEDALMATNKPAGDGHRNGPVKDRSQLEAPVMGEERFTKRDKTNW